ncbi:DoxX family protein [uncultured Thiocystis sp.]|jgi:putative oxidoreductase|uniref:DoxX family protein n=1 Tax=uncultured Thiocystis sp. TaxID=1202134 RepID=UPI0025F228A0|nr:DoxX family protein [uncultured Thiocystis sp.]
MKPFLPGPWPDLGILFLRLGAGITMMVHGGLKFAGGQSFLSTVGANWSAAIGIHFAPLSWGIFVALVQTLGGLLIAVGFLSRPAAILLTFVMAVGAVMVYQKTGMTFKEWSHPLEAALTCLAIFVMGSGRFSLEANRIRGRSAGPNL